MKKKTLFLIAFLIALILMGGVFVYRNFKDKKIEKKHVGVLACLEYFATTADSFKDKMEELGYVEGKNIVYEIEKRPTENEAEEKQIIQKFVDEKVDLIVVMPTGASLVAKELTQGTNIPIVFGSAFTDGNNLIESIVHPGGNITGVRWPSSAESGVENLKIIHEILPKATRLWLTYQEDYISVSQQLKAIRTAAKPMGITILENPAHNLDDIRDGLSQLENRKEKIDAILMLAEPLATSREGLQLLSNFSERHKIPMMGVEGKTTIFGMAPDAVKSGKQAALLADKVLRGAVAGTIPVVSVESDLKIYYGTAKKMGIEIPESILFRAKEIIK